MRITIAALRTGLPGYRPYLAPILANPEPAIRDDAEIDMTTAEHAGKIWWLAIAAPGVDTHAGPVPSPRVIAWCAAWPSQDSRYQIECGHNYERRGLGREAGAYRHVFAARQTWLIEQRPTAVTYIFDQPVELHEAAGWTRTGLHRMSTHGHHWQQLVWQPA